MERSLSRLKSMLKRWLSWRQASAPVSERGSDGARELEVAGSLSTWVSQRVWGASREYLLTRPDLLTTSSGLDRIGPEWRKLLQRAQEVGVDVANGELL